jgi:hypothetical protein
MYRAWKYCGEPDILIRINHLDATLLNHSAIGTIQALCNQLWMGYGLTLFRIKCNISVAIILFSLRELVQTCWL